MILYNCLAVNLEVDYGGHRLEQYLQGRLEAHLEHTENFGHKAIHKVFFPPTPARLVWPFLASSFNLTDDMEILLGKVISEIYERHYAHFHAELFRMLREGVIKITIFSANLPEGHVEDVLILANYQMERLDPTGIGDTNYGKRESFMREWLDRAYIRTFNTVIDTMKDEVTDVWPSVSSNHQVTSAVVDSIEKH